MKFGFIAWFLLHSARSFIQTGLCKLAIAGNRLNALKIILEYKATYSVTYMSKVDSRIVYVIQITKSPWWCYLIKINVQENNPECVC